MPKDFVAFVDGPPIATLGTQFETSKRNDFRTLILGLYKIDYGFGLPGTKP